MKFIPTLCVTTLAGVLAFLAPSAHADMITALEIVPIPAGVTGSGNGTLDIRLFTSETADNKQQGCGNNCLNWDDGNTSLPKGDGSADDGSYIESYVTTAGELQAFYTLNFGAGNIDEIVLFLDLNEVDGDFGSINHFERMDVILNPDTINGDPDPSGDVQSGPAKNPPGLVAGTQNYIKQGFTGGSLIAWLDPNILTGGPTPFYNLPLNVQGAGFADYAIFTGIDPYSLNAADVLLFNQSISFLSNGGETKFLSGEFSGDDICTPGVDCPPEIPPPGAVPEPATMLLLGTGLVGIAGVARRRKKKLM